MNYFAHNGCVYKGDRGCCSPVREIPRISEEEASRLERLEKEAKEARKKDRVYWKKLYENF